MADGSNRSTIITQRKPTLVLVRDAEQDEESIRSDSAEVGRAMGALFFAMQNLNGTGARFVVTMVENFLASAPPWFFRN